MRARWVSVLAAALACNGQGPSAPSPVLKAPVESARAAPKPPPSSTDAGAAPARADDAGAVGPADRCRVAGTAQLVDVLSRCPVREAVADEPGLASKLRVLVSVGTLTAGATTEARITLENETNAEVRVPFVWSGSVDDPTEVSLRTVGGKSYDTRDNIRCSVQPRSAEIVLAPYASLVWSVDVSAVKRHTEHCATVPQGPLPAGRYLLRVAVPVATTPDLGIDVPATVMARPP